MIDRNFEINKIETDVSVTFSIIANQQLALSELSVFTKELAVDFIESSELNRKQKNYIHEILNKSNNAYFFNRLNVPKKMTNRGIGTKLLQETINFIYGNNYFLINTANSYGEKDQEELVRFYQKNGMILIHKEGLLVYHKDINLTHLLSLDKNPKKAPKWGNNGL